MLKPTKVPFKLQDYDFTDVIGDGAFSIIYKAKKGKQVYAIKQVPFSMLKNENDFTQMQREIDSLAFLKHDNIVQLRDFFTNNKFFYLVCDYCGFGNLFDAIVGNKFKNEAHASKIFYQIVTAIQYCHERGVAHRDLKSLNILFDRLDHIKICDFGLCAFFNENEKFKTSCGSPCYASPECIQGEEYDGKLSDIWSLGVILFEMMNRTQPWDMTNTSKCIQTILAADYKIPKECNENAAELIRGMLKIKPGERLTIEQLLQHPWIKKSAIPVPTRSASSNSLNTSKLILVQHTIKRTDSDKEFGVVSPFKEIEGSPIRPPKRRRNTMGTFSTSEPNLENSFLRSPSCETFCESGAVSEDDNK